MSSGVIIAAATPESTTTSPALAAKSGPDTDGDRPAQRDTPPWQWRFPTSSWQPGSLIVDINDRYLPPGLTPGEYRVVVGMYDPVTWARPLVTVNGIAVPDGAVEVARVLIAP